MKVVKDTQAFLDKFNLSCLNAPGIHSEIQVRLGHLQEELDELITSTQNNDLCETIDALVDLVYVAVGTANLCGFNFESHWDEVQRANMTKIRGITKRGSKFDVCKPEGWTGPRHQMLLDMDDDIRTSTFSPRRIT